MSGSYLRKHGVFCIPWVKNRETPVAFHRPAMTTRLRSCTRHTPPSLPHCNLCEKYFKEKNMLGPRQKMTQAQVVAVVARYNTVSSRYNTVAMNQLC